MYQKLALIPGHCLFPDHSSLEIDEKTIVYMAEDEGLCTHFKYHKQKLVLFLSAMRSHADRISQEHDLHYIKIDEGSGKSYSEKLSDLLKKSRVKEIVTYVLEDEFFRREIEQLCDSLGIELTQKDSPAFLYSVEEFGEYLDSHKPFMHTWYKQQRKKYKILMDGSEPVNGKWSFDEDNRKKLPKNTDLPTVAEWKYTEHTKEVIDIVEDMFPDHPGKANEFNWPTTREQALECLDLFLEERFEDFGPYEDAFEPDQTFLFHSTLSPLINCGILTPQEVIDKALEHAHKHETHYPSLEGFVRQIMGWREFIRGCYHHLDFKKNFFEHKRKLKSCWYDATTGLSPVDDSIKKAVRYAYTHHIERLMILGNTMLLCGIDPNEVNKWFMEMYIDSSDWVMVPNVFGMSQFADGGSFATKPYIAGSNYLLKMSHYRKGEWCEIMDGLYWNFIDTHKEVFAKNQRMSMMVKMLEKLDPERKERIFQKAADFIESVTSE